MNLFLNASEIEMFSFPDAVDSLNTCMESLETTLRRSNVVEVDARNRMMEVSRGLKVLVSFFVTLRLCYNNFLQHDCKLLRCFRMIDK